MSQQNVMASVGSVDAHQDVACWLQSDNKILLCVIQVSVDVKSMLVVDQVAGSHGVLMAELDAWIAIVQNAMDLM